MKPARRLRGFTLLELMVALAIAAVLLGVVPLAAHKAYESIEYRATVRELLTALRSARQHAAEQGRPVRFVLDLHKREFGEEGRVPDTFPARFDLRATLARSETQREGVGAIRFFPDGSSTGGSVTLVRPSGQGVRLRVDWLLGRITQEAPDARGAS